MKIRVLFLNIIFGLSLFAAQNGIGGGSLEPCQDFMVGELMASYSESGYNVKIYYQGNCEARVEKKYPNGNWVVQPYWIAAPCDCGALPSGDQLIDLDIVGGSGGNGGVTIIAEKPIAAFEVIDLGTGKPYFGSSCQADGIELNIPGTGLIEGQKYGVIAYDSEGNSKGFCLFSMDRGRPVEGGFFATWTDERGADITMTCLFYVGDQRLEIFQQHADGHLTWTQGFAPLH